MIEVKKMAVKQLTVFLENHQGQLVQVTDLLGKNGIDMRALSIADTQDFGILRLIVSDTQKALTVLKNNDYLVQITEVVGVSIPDRAGELSRALALLDQANINIEYLYAFLTNTAGSAQMVFRVADNAAAAKVLEDAGYQVL